MRASQIQRLSSTANSDAYGARRLSKTEERTHSRRLATPSDHPSSRDPVGFASVSKFNACDPLRAPIFGFSASFYSASHFRQVPHCSPPRPLRQSQRIPCGTAKVREDASGRVLAKISH